jgi:hypothetical protein
MCTPLAAAGIGLQGIGMLANNQAGGRYARAQQDAIDRDVKISREQFDDRNQRIIGASGESLQDTRRGYDIMLDTISNRRGIDRDTRFKRGEAATEFNKLTAGARERQAGYRAEGDAVVDDAVGAMDFGKREAGRKNSANYRDALTQGTITAPSPTLGQGSPDVIARDFAEMAAGKVGQARAAGTAAATADSYGDALRTGDETIDTAEEGISRIGRTSDRDLSSLNPALAVHGGAYDRALSLGSAKIKDLLEKNAGKASFTEDRANRIVNQSMDNETTSASILDSWVGALNGSSSNYEEALRRNAQIKLQGMPRTSSLGNLFGAIGAGLSPYAASGQGPSWGSVTRFFSPHSWAGGSGAAAP